MNKEINNSEKPAKITRFFKGIVVSAAMDKTIVVERRLAKVHPLYKKQFTRSKKYKVHDAKNEYQIGDEVEFVGCRPMSKDKKWRVVRKITKQDKE